MIYVISKSTFGEYGVRDIQCNANWDCCPYSDYALIPEDLVDGILATQGYCDIVLSIDGTVVQGFIARSIPSVPEECHGVNTVLSVNGVRANTGGEVNLKPADVGAAPAGYGLGEQAARFADIDDATANGFYTCDGDPMGVNTKALVLSCNEYDRQQIAANQNTVMLRSYSGGAYKEWEYVNPPMMVGVEYRTIERFLGKPVYCKVYNLGVCGDGTRVAHGIPTTYYKVRVDSSVFPFFADTKLKPGGSIYDSWITIEGTDIVVHRVGTDTYQYYVTIFYTK